MSNLYLHGTRLVAEGGPYIIEGRLIGDHDSLDGSVYVLTDQDEALLLNGWLFTFEIVALPAPRLRQPNEPPRPRAAVSIQSATGRASSMRPHRHWQRPWYLRRTE